MSIYKGFMQRFGDWVVPANTKMRELPYIADIEAYLDALDFVACHSCKHVFSMAEMYTSNACSPGCLAELEGKS